MKKSITIFILLAIADNAIAQDTLLTNYRHNLSVAKDDTSRVRAMIDFGYYYTETKPDSSLIYGYKALELARKIKFAKGEFEVLELLILTQGSLGNDTKQLQLIFQAQKSLTQGTKRHSFFLTEEAFMNNPKIIQRR